VRAQWSEDEAAAYSSRRPSVRAGLETADVYQGRHMSWVLLVGVAWLVLAVAVAVLIGRSVRLADLKAAGREAVPSPHGSAPIGAVDAGTAERPAHHRPRAEGSGRIPTARSA
jgi:hypothetical protein